MRKLLLMSILPMTVVIPMLAAREKDVRKGARKTMLWSFLFIVLWTLLIYKAYWLLPAPQVDP